MKTGFFLPSHHFIYKNDALKKASESLKTKKKIRRKPDGIAKQQKFSKQKNFFCPFFAIEWGGKEKSFNYVSNVINFYFLLLLLSSSLFPVCSALISSIVTTHNFLPSINLKWSLISFSLNHSLLMWQWRFLSQLFAFIFVFRFSLLNDRWDYDFDY